MAASQQDETRVTPRRLVFANRKGGCGKTTTAVNVAHGLARKGARVLLVDMDPQAHATLSVGVRPTGAARDICHVLTRDGVCGDAIHTTAIDNLSLIPASLELSAFEIENATRSGAETWLARELGTLGASFDYIVLDPPPTIGLLAVSALVAAKEAYIPMQLHFLSMEGLAEMMRLIYRINATYNPHLRLSGIIPTFYNRQTRLAREILAEIRATFGPDRVVPGVRINVSLAEAPGHGKTIFDYAPASAGAADYSRVAEWIFTGGITMAGGEAVQP